MINDLDFCAARKQQIENLTDFISGKFKRLSQLTNTLGWTVESLKNQNKVQCKFNSGHWVEKSALKKHEDVCSIVSEGYSRQELDRETFCSYFPYKKSGCTPIKIGKEEMKEIIFEACNNSEMPPDIFKNFKYQEMSSFPKTMDRYLTEFTPQERLTIYDYVVKKNEDNKSSANFELGDLCLDFEKKEEVEKEKSYLEILAEKRDYKRRRQSYRAKNVHITKKSYTEVMKEVIENQISYLKETRKTEEGEVQDSDESRQNVNEASDTSQGNAKSRYEKDDRDRKSHHCRDRHRSRDRDHHHRRDRSRSSSRRRSKHKHKKHKSHHR